MKLFLFFLFLLVLVVGWPWGGFSNRATKMRKLDLTLMRLYKDRKK